jgi:hypothetical protein
VWRGTQTSEINNGEIGDSALVGHTSEWDSCDQSTQGSWPTITISVAYNARGTFICVYPLKRAPFPTTYHGTNICWHGFYQGAYHPALNWLPRITIRRLKNCCRNLGLVPSRKSARQWMTFFVVPRTIQASAAVDSRCEAPLEIPSRGEFSWFCVSLSPSLGYLILLHEA